MDSVSLRMLELMKDSGLNRSDFAHRLGVSQGVISHISSGRNKPGLEMVVECLKAFPEISADWLLLGVGDMKRDKTPDKQLKQLTQLLDEVKLLNDMNYNSLASRIELIQKRISEG
jgi:transcriptional regulator with XRE-family HTH domain